MKVVLMKSVRGTGHTGEVVNVSDGHALNYLMPHGFALPATPANLKQAELRSKQAQDRKDLDHKLVADRIAALSEGSITIVKKANEKGHLYDAVDAAEIAAAAGLPEDAIKLEKPIKELGAHSVAVAVGEVFGSISITVSEG